MTYEFKVGPELVRVALVTALVFTLQLVIGFDWDAVNDWAVYGRSVGISLAQAVAAAVLAVITSGRASAPAEEPEAA